MLTVTSEHALRALIQLAHLPPGGSLRGVELARQAGVPPKYLSKIMLSLRDSGLVSATRGAGGGYRLRKQATEIPLQEVVTLFEGSPVQPGCVLGFNKTCSEERPCTAHWSWGNLRVAYMHFLESTTLHDIAFHHDKVRVGRFAEIAEAAKNESADRNP
jgi:Rrf2 family protein